MGSVFNYVTIRPIPKYQKANQKTDTNTNQTLTNTNQESTFLPSIAKQAEKTARICCAISNVTKLPRAPARTELASCRRDAAARASGDAPPFCVRPSAFPTEQIELDQILAYAPRGFADMQDQGDFQARWVHSVRREIILGAPNPGFRPLLQQ